tara:strand:+ start:529 stop:1209 length:681 start_codon:yes stop_codon:yes gene_type:complete
MKPVIEHSWNLTEKEAIALQQQLAAKVVSFDDFDHVKLVAGVDVAYQKHGDKLVAAVVVLDAETLDVIETSIAEAQVQFPYIPGLFSFRELPPLINAFDQLQHKPNLVVCDGQGLAHPRRFGLACHLGVIFNIPSIGCGKTRLLGKHEEPVKERGGIAPLMDNNEVIGAAVRTQTNIKPIYVSIGHKISLNSACHWITRLSPAFRLPETTRQADQQVNRICKAQSC